MKTLITLLFAVLTLSVSAQKIVSNVYHSTGGQTGLQLLKIKSNGFTIGIGGSYLFSSYDGETKNYQELANAILPIKPENWAPQYRSAFYKTFDEYRGTFHLLAGYTLDNTTFTGLLGIAPRSRYYLAKDGAAPMSHTEPIHRYFFTFEHIAPRAMIGANLSHTIGGRWGIHVGYNNIEKLTYGIKYTITPTSMFNW